MVRFGSAAGELVELLRALAHPVDVGRGVVGRECSHLLEPADVGIAVVLELLAPAEHATRRVEATNLDQEVQRVAHLVEAVLLQPVVPQTEVGLHLDQSPVLHAKLRHQGERTVRPEQTLFACLRRLDVLCGERPLGRVVLEVVVHTLEDLGELHIILLPPPHYRDKDSREARRQVLRLRHLLGRRRARSHSHLPRLLVLQDLSRHRPSKPTLLSAKAT